MMESAIDWSSEADAGGTGERKDSRLFWIAITASLLVHGGLILALSSLSAPSPPQATPIAVHIRLVPDNPQITRRTDAVLAPQAVPVQTLVSPPTPVTGNGSDAPASSRPDAAASPVSVPETAPPATPASEATPNLTPPTLVHIQDTLDALREGKASQSWLYSCNPLEEEARVINCGDVDATDYTAITQNPVYTALNPRREFSRSERATATLASHAVVLAERLEAAVMATPLKAYVMAELEAGVSLYSLRTATPELQLRRMANRSAAAQQAERVLGDGWVQAAMRELVQRKVDAD